MARLSPETEGSLGGDEDLGPGKERSEAFPNRMRRSQRVKMVRPRRPERLPPCDRRHEHPVAAPGTRHASAIRAEERCTILRRRWVLATV